MYVGNVAALEEFLLGGAMHIIIALEQRYWLHDLQSTYAEQRAKLITVGGIVVEAGHSYGISGVADIGNSIDQNQSNARRAAVVMEQAQEDTGEARDNADPDSVGGGFSPELG